MARLIFRKATRNTHSIEYSSPVTVPGSSHHSCVPSAGMRNEITITSEQPPLSLPVFFSFFYSGIGGHMGSVGYAMFS